MKIILDSALNLFIPVAPQEFEAFKQSFILNVESAELINVDTDIVRERILSKKPELSESINDFIPSMESLKEDGLQMVDLSIQGTDDSDNSVNRIVSLNRLRSYDRGNTYEKVYKPKKAGNKTTYELNISSIVFDATTKTVIFS